MHSYDLILTLTLGLSGSLILGYGAQRLKLSPILGYLLAGILLGPYTPGLEANLNFAVQMAEIGVILLMFGVGLHFQLKDLLAVKSIALPGAVGQSLVATALGTGVGWYLGWGLGAGVVLGIAISVASTVVLIRALMDRNALGSPEGHIAVGWLIVEDIFTVLVLVLLPIVYHALTQESGSWLSIGSSMGIAVLKLIVMGVVVLVAGGKVVPWLLGKVARTRSQELFTLAILTFALVIAMGSAYLFGSSMALGAFLAGMVVGQSALSHQAAANALPMRDAFAVIFFVSVGMLFDPHFILSQPLLVLATLAIVLIAKPLAALLIVTFFGYSIRTALTVAAALAQIGEFSFILGELARQLEILPQEGYSLLVVAAIVSISVNPLLFKLSDWVEIKLHRKSKLWQWLRGRSEEKGHELNLKAQEKLSGLEPSKVRAIVIGCGPVGKTLTQILDSFGIHPVIVDLNIDTVTRLTTEGFSAIYGDGGNPDILKVAQVDQAKYMVITLPELIERIPVIVAAREINEGLAIFSRARYLAERATLEEFGVTEIRYEEVEAAVGLSECLLRAEGIEDQRIKTESKRIRLEFSLIKE